jgi:hypothetical protein
MGFNSAFKELTLVIEFIQHLQIISHVGTLFLAHIDSIPVLKYTIHSNGKNLHAEFCCTGGQLEGTSSGVQVQTIVYLFSYFYNKFNLRAK